MNFDMLNIKITLHLCIVNNAHEKKLILQNLLECSYPCNIIIDDVNI